MKVFKNLRYKIQSLLLKKLFISGVEILRAHDIEVEIEKLQSIKNLKPAVFKEIALMAKVFMSLKMKIATKASLKIQNFMAKA